MDVIVIIAGIYILIKWAFQSSYDKKSRKAFEEHLKNVDIAQESVKNSDLEHELETMNEYKLIREHKDLIDRVVGPVCPLGKVENGKLFNERFYHEIARQLVVAMIMSERGFLPWKWFWPASKSLIDIGAACVKCGIEGYELIAIAKYIQSNLRSNGKNIDICILIDEKTKRVGVFPGIVCDDEEMIPVDRISLDRLGWLW